MATSISSSPVRHPSSGLNSPKLSTSHTPQLAPFTAQISQPDTVSLGEGVKSPSFEELMQQTQALIEQNTDFLRPKGFTSAQLNTIQPPDALLKAQETGKPVNPGMIDTLQENQGQNMQELFARQQRALKESALNSVKRSVPMLVAGTTPDKAFEKFNAPGMRAESLSMLDVEKAFNEAGHQVSPFKGAYEHALGKWGSKDLLAKIRKV